MKKIFIFPFTILAYIFGCFSWDAPIWLKQTLKFLKASPLLTSTFVIMVIIATSGYFYYDSLPKPIMVKAVFNEIEITQTYAGAKPDNLSIEFEYDLSVLNDDQRRPEGLPSVARIDLVGQQVKQGINLTPAKKGSWTWISDRRLQFVPETDWPAGTEYSVSFDKSVFVNEAILSKDKYFFTTPELSAEFTHIEFYQDPQDVSIRRVVSTIQFSHPVVKESLEKSISMFMRPSGENINVAEKPYSFKISYNKNNREAYIQSEAVALPEKPNYMKLNLEKGLVSILGGAATQNKSETKILIPDIYSYLKVSNAQVQVIRNEKNEPEQLLTLEFTDEINQQELLSKLSIKLLPKNDERNGKQYWESPREVSTNVLLDSDQIYFSLIPNERASSKIYSFSLDIPENRFLYLNISKGLVSVNKFIQSSFYDAVLRVPEYPKEIEIAGDGSVLTYTGNHKLSISSRGVPALIYSVGRILKGQINHLISQTSGDISSPKFNNWYFDEQNITESESYTLDLGLNHPKKANYSSIDLSEYLPEEKNRFGLFFIEIKAWDIKNDREIYGVSDKRVILVTDLGIIVKNNADSSHDVFVQSIADGKPVAGASVELLGKNGIALYVSKTDALGHVSFPSTNVLNREKTPTVYVVKTEQDMSFIPYDRSSRQINLSRFDIGGVRSSQVDDDSLNAFLFSDRGIYRPGETINVGVIVKKFDLSNVENIPLEVVIRDPRNKEIKVEKFTLSEKGFDEFKYRTEATSDTGNYSVSLHLVRDDKYRGRTIGGTNFKVEEFQPDTLKIQSKLIDVVEKGWNTQDKIKSSVSLKNLFGLPAQDRKLTGRVIIKPYHFKFDKFKDYKFTDHYLEKNKKPLSLDKYLGEKRTNADGLAEFEIDLQKFRAGTYSLQLITEGFDQAGGRSVVATNSALISPLDMIIGYKSDGGLGYINADSDRNVNFIAVNKLLKKQESKGLRLKLKNIQQVSTLVKQNNGTYKYQTIEKEEEVSVKDISIGKSGYDYKIDTATAGDFALEIVDDKNRRLSRLVYSVVGFANLAGRIDKRAELSVKLNKNDYYPGDVIEMSIKAPYSGAGLISIETDRVHEFKWFKTSAESTVQTIRLPENLEGGGYVNVAFVRDISSSEIFSSPLSYAVAPFSIDKSKRRVNITLATKDIVRPGKPMEINFKTSKPSRIAIFAVDEGVLQVAKYKTPDPLSHYLKKRSLDVETLQILDLILPDFDLVKELSASGGGSRAKRKALAKNLNPFRRKTDKPAVYWSGIYDANEENKQVIFNVPNTFAGELRVMAVAVGDESVGATSASSIVRGPFVISPNLLTQAAPGDEFQVTVGVANSIKGSGKNAIVNLSVSSSKHLQILDKKSTALVIDEGSEGKYTFKVKATSNLGAAELKFVASHKKEESMRTASLSVRPATNYYTTLNSGVSDNGLFELDLPRSLHADLAKQKIAASASPLVIVDGLVSFLDNYPHGCTEQIVSKVFPLVGLLSHPAYAPHLPKVKEQFAYLIDKLRERQLADGGFAFWAGQQNSAEYPTIYVMHFLFESSELGYPVPTDMLQRGKDYLNGYVAQSASTLNAARNRANAIYLLARMGEVTTNYLVDLEEELKKNHKDVWRQDIVSSYMAATYHLLQKEEEANRLISGYQLSSKKQGETDDFHSLLAVDAQYVYLLAKHFKNKAENLNSNNILKLTEEIYKGKYNTISSAYTILALDAYSQLVLKNKFNEKIEFESVDANNIKQKLEAALKPFMQASFSTDARKLNIIGENSLFYINSQSGFNNSLPEKPVTDGLEIYRDFLDEKGNVVTTLEQGKEVTVRLKIRALNEKRLNNIAVIDLLPGGFEVVRSSVSRKAYNWRADYIDIREDRVVYYGAFDNTLRELTYRAKLTSAGEFTVPPSYAESMYDRSVRAISKAGKFSVIASQ